MQVMTGTSGFSYAAWRGSFYPKKLPQAEMLAFYAGKLGAVEINSTFYRLPNASLLERWAAATPGSFRFALKSPRGITHMRRLAGADDGVARLADRAGALGDRLGPILFQLPATLRKDVGLAGGVPRDAARRACARRSSSGTSRGSPTTCTPC